MYDNQVAIHDRLVDIRFRALRRAKTSWFIEDEKGISLKFPFAPFLKI